MNTMRGVGPVWSRYALIAQQIKTNPRPQVLPVVLGVATALMDALAVALVVSLLFSLLNKDVLEGKLDILFTWAGGSHLSLAGMILALVITKAALSYANASLTIRLKNRLTTRIMNAVHAALVEMPYAELRKRGAATLLNTAATDSWQVANAAYLVTRIAVNAATIGVFIAVVCWLSWRIAFAALIGVCIILVIGSIAGRLAKARGAAVRGSVEMLYTRILTAVHSGRLLRAYAGEMAERQRVKNETRALERRLNTLEMTDAAIVPLNEVSYVALLVGLVVLASVWGVPHAISLSVIALLYRLSPHIREIEANRVALAGLWAPLDRVSLLLDRPSPHEMGDRFDGKMSIRFEEVTFRLADRADPILRNVSFAIDRGACVALIGPSGVGKTSVINLLLRLYDVDSGVITVDGAPLQTIARSDWLQHVAVAGQDIDIMEGTLAENLRLGAPQASMEALRSAAADAGILDFIDSLPEGLDTWVGTFGYNLSGGQRQRISLARAFLRSPQLLLLDETTNAVESTLETVLLQNIRRRCPGATILLVTHRLNKAARVDTVIELTVDGRVETYNAEQIAL